MTLATLQVSFSLRFARKSRFFKKRRATVSRKSAAMILEGLAVCVILRAHREERREMILCEVHFIKPLNCVGWNLKKHILSVL